MVVDPTQPEKGVFTEYFKIPSSCSCSIVPEDESKRQTLLDEMMNTKPKSRSDVSKAGSTSKKSMTKQNTYPSYDYGYDEGYFDDETTTHSGKD